MRQEPAVLTFLFKETETQRYYSDLPKSTTLELQLKNVEHGGFFFINAYLQTMG